MSAMTLRGILGVLQRTAEKHPEHLDLPLAVRVRSGKTSRSDRMASVEAVVRYSEADDRPSGLELWTERRD